MTWPNLVNFFLPKVAQDVPHKVPQNPAALRAVVFLAIFEKPQGVAPGLGEGCPGEGLCPHPALQRPGGRCDVAAGYGDGSESGTGVLLHTGRIWSASVWTVCLFLKETTQFRENFDNQFLRNNWCHLFRNDNNLEKFTATFVE